ncbi:PucR family transcriptional regulator [Rhodococcus gannanensis]|uniref:PucR family transcriptional regulator n=1 Tax=Rhodococcus gannanensis TaxID=1960308 RepID=A0ABW4P3L2_9NOCA
MATIGDLADHAGLRSLTPDALVRTRRTRIDAVHRVDGGPPADLPENSALYVPSTAWPRLPAPGALTATLRSAGGVAVIVDNNDVNLPPEFLSECVRQSFPVFLLPSDQGLDRVAAVIRPPEPGHPAERSAGAGRIRDVVDSFVGSSEIDAWLVMRGCVVGGSRRPAPTTDRLRKVLARNPVTLDRIAAAPAVVTTTLPRSGRTMALVNPQRTPWDSRRVRALAEQLDAYAQAVEVARTARQQSEYALIRELITATVPSEALDPWASSLGLTTGIRIRAVCLVPPDSVGAQLDEIAAALRDLGLLSGQPCVAGTHGGNAYALITISGDPDENPSFEDDLDVLRGLVERQCGFRPAVGASSCVLHGSDDLVRGLISARQLAERQARTSARDDGSVPLPAPLAATLLASEPTLVTVLQRALLQPVIDYDTQKGSQYLHTLRTFLALDGHWGSAASELGIHINTLRYRLGRIERLTGRGVHATADRTDFYLALTLYESGERR